MGKIVVLYSEIQSKKGVCKMSKFSFYGLVLGLLLSSSVLGGVEAEIGQNPRCSNLANQGKYDQCRDGCDMIAMHPGYAGCVNKCTKDFCPGNKKL